MRKLFTLLVLTILIFSCGVKKEVQDFALEGVFIQNKDIKYQVYQIRNVHYINMWCDKKNKMIRQKVYIAVVKKNRK